MKRIITCSDGTWNKPDNKDGDKTVKTNVAKMFECICASGADKVKQLKIYGQGVGTGYTVKDRILGGATGAGIDKNIKDLYTFLALTYEAGDQIFLFGFSRGAYTVRSLAGFIRNCGVLKPEHIALVDKAYSLYRDRNSYSVPDSDLMLAFREKYCVENITPIKFLGVWDTVGSLGIPLPWYKLRNMNQYKFHDVTLSSTIEHAYHALAIDEKRVLFTPAIWNKSNTVKNNPAHQQVLEQRWFTGVHSNVGGGYADCGLSNIALRWLKEKAEATGLCFNDNAINDEDDDKGVLRNSYTPLYRLWPPRYRQILLHKNNNQVIDKSAWQRFNNAEKKYAPKNLKMIAELKKALGQDLL